MIPVTNVNLFNDALRILSQHRKDTAPEFKGRFMQLFLAIKYFQNNIPSMYSGTFISTEMLQSLLDDLFSKASRTPNNCVLSLFEENFLARTGLIGLGNTTSQNTWRNNLNLQKGIGCYAPVADLSSPTFLNQNRSFCRYLAPSTPGNLAGGRCSLCASNAEYRNESHRKWLRIDPGGAGYAYTDIQNISNFIPYIAPGGKKVPLIPLIIALYHDADPGLTIGTRSNVSIADFSADFNFSAQEMAAYFDVSMTHPLNAAITHSNGWQNSTLGPLTLPPPPLVQNSGGPQQVIPTPNLPVQPILGGTPVPPPLVNSGWDAEQYVANALIAAGWTTHVVSRQQLGYDIYIQKGRQRRYIEVKSSVGNCSPSLTAREWQQAKYYNGQYILAVIENFSPNQMNSIHWIPDPANRCSAIQQLSVSHGISRSSWVVATVPIADI